MSSRSPIAAAGGDRDEDEGLDADRRRVDELRRLGDASHPVVIRYADRLRDYGIAVLMKQWHADALRPIIGRRIGLLYAPHSTWSTDAIRSIVCYSVCRSVPPFIDTAILGGGWDPSRRMRVKNYFVGRCYYSFADDYRKEWEQDKLASDALSLEPDLTFTVIEYVQQSLGPNPADTAERRDTIKRLLALTQNNAVPDIAWWRSQGYSYIEIAKLLGMTEETVRGIMRRFITMIRERRTS